VRGVGDDFWSTFVDPDPTDPHKRILTVWGQDKININTANPITMLTIACTAEPTSPLCTDPLQYTGFLQAMSLIRSFTQGAPLFQKPDDFIALMGGTGPIGPLLAGPPFNVTPVKFKSPAEVRAQIGVLSKMFSIYAEGVVPGFKRTTRVKIHAVVDFRSAQEIGDSFTPIAGGTTAPPPPQQVLSAPRPGALGQTGGSNQAAGQATPEQLAAVMAANPAGSIVYWRLE
jgi:general secretion pathway protein K